MKKTKAKTKKKLIIFLVFLLMMSVSAMLYASSIIEDPVQITFQDKNLYDKIKGYYDDYNLKFNTDDASLTLTVSDKELGNIEELVLNGSDGTKINNITGLEKFRNLKKINLADNNIVDIGALENLTSLISADFTGNSSINLYNKTDNTCYLPNQANFEELYIANTNNTKIEFVENLPKLKVLNVSNNSIPSLEGIGNLSNIEKLDVSDNSLNLIDEIYTLTTLKELNIATNQITNLLHSAYQSNSYEVGIFLLTNLEKLNVENNALTSIEPIYRTFLNSERKSEIYLKNLKSLNVNFTGQKNVSFRYIALLESLTHLYMKGNGITQITNDIATMPNLQHINLAENEIQNISGFVKYDSNNNITHTLSATEIILEKNRIQDITPLSNLGHDITYLDLSSNIIFYTDGLEGRYTFSQGLDLTRQGRDKYDSTGKEQVIWYMDVKQKAANMNQYIILPTLFQNSKKEGSIVYADNTNFSFENIYLNNDPKYNTPGNFNIVIEPPAEGEKDRVMSITLHGGCADNSILHFRLSNNTSSIDSLLFEDPNLAAAIDADLTARVQSNTYIKRAVDLLNITYKLVGETVVLHLENKNISNLSGLASFENLTQLYLSNNNVSTIDEIKDCKKIKELYVSNNPNIGNNNSAIENLTNLTNLDLSTTGMTNITSLQNLISKWETNKRYPLKYLNISNNVLGTIENIGKVTSLEELYISNIKIQNIDELETLINLKTLNTSLNNIQDIEKLEGLVKLRYLNISNNQIENIVPISQIPLDNLDFSNNRVKDVSSLTNGYTTINMDTNQISDISNFDGRLITNFSVANQKISHAIDSAEDTAITIPLPEILKDSKDTTSKVYSEKNYIIANCELSSDGNSVTVNPAQLGNKIATVKIDGGNGNRTTFSIATPLIGTITYTPEIEGPTNQDITAKITFNRNENVKIINNDGSDTYVFTQNGEFTFEFVDEYGFEGTATAIVTNIDKIAPQATNVTQEVASKKVIVKIYASEPIAQPDGWTISDDGLSITKTYDVDTRETVKLIDEAGNETDVNVEVKIDKTAPKITGVSDGEKYNRAVTPVIEDENLDKVTLTKNEVVVANYVAGTEISEVGQYVLKAVDTFENESTVSFEIESVSDIITSTTSSIIVTENEDMPHIRGIAPNTIVSDIKGNLQAEMSYQIIDKNGNTVTDTSTIGTGYQIKMSNGKLYTLIVWGDITGDGEISISELAVASRIAANPSTEISELNLLALDVSKDGSIKVPDLAVLSRLRNAQ